MQTKDCLLAEKIREGDESAFKKLYDRYHEALYFIAIRYLKNEDLAKDAVQTAFLKLWNKRKKLDSSLSIRGFLFTMLRNHVLDMMRKRESREKAWNNYKIFTEDNSLRNTTEEKVIYDEYKDLTDQALKQLSPAVKRVFVMKNYKGFSNAEIANKHDVSVNTVKSQFYVGSKYIRDYLKKHADF